MRLARALTEKKIADIDHDLLQKNAYVMIRWARHKHGDESAEEQCKKAEKRLLDKLPELSIDDIEEAVCAMYINMVAELGERKT